MMRYDVKDPALSQKGKKRIEWAEMDMPVLRRIKENFSKKKPLKGVKIAACLHGATQTAHFAIKGEDNKTYYKHLNEILDRRPNITMDDGADLVSLLHSKRANDAKGILGSTEETKTGVIRLKSL